MMIATGKIKGEVVVSANPNSDGSPRKTYTPDQITALKNGRVTWSKRELHCCVTFEPKFGCGTYGAECCLASACPCFA